MTRNIPEALRRLGGQDETLDEVASYLWNIGQVIAALPREPLAEISELLMQAGREGKLILILGNGGSAATASHLACDLAKTASVPGHPRMRAVALTDNVPLLTAWGNDASYDLVFAEQVRTLASPGDLVVAISASGNSPNVLAAAAAAREVGAHVVGVTGFGGGRLQSLCDTCLVVPSHQYGPVEDAHMILVHVVTSAIRASLMARQSTAVVPIEAGEAAVH
ncbi:MAG: SIS domain-containing protein [Ktedonobacterales bacterium]